MTAHWLNSRYEKQGLLLTAQLDLTLRCNLDCRMCFHGGHRSDELSLSEIRILLGELANLGALQILFSGGEVFLRKDTLEIIESARTLGFRVSVKSNGTRMTPEDCEAMVRLGVSRVDLSLYSHNAEIHDAVTRVPGSFRRTIDALLSLQAKPRPEVRAVVTLLRGYETEPSVVLDGLTALGVGIVVFNEVRGDIRETGYPVNEFLLSPEQYLTSFRQMFSGSMTPRTVDPDEALCRAGRTHIYIAPDGSVRPCLPWPDAIGNVRETPITEIWHHHPLLQQLRSLTRGQLKGCADCADIAWCAVCPARAVKQNGDPTRPAPEDCARAATIHDIGRNLDSREDDR